MERKIKCSCGGNLCEEEIKLEGVKTKALVCGKCHKTTFTKEQAVEFAKLKEVQSMIGNERKIIKIGNSIGITLPEKLGLKVGKKVKTEVIDNKSFKVVFG